MNPTAGDQHTDHLEIEPSQRQFIERVLADCVPASGSTESRHGSLLRLAHRRLFKDGASVSEVRAELQRHRRTTRVIAVTSGKGGVGKTTVSVNLAVALSQRGLRVLVFDADLGMANLHVFAGVNPASTLADVIAGRANLRSAVAPGPAGMDVICGASGVGWLADLRATQLDALGRELLAVAADYDVLILDTGAGIAASVVQFLALAQEIIVVTTPNLAATLDAYGVVKLARESRIAANLHVVINQCDNEADAARAADRITGCAARFLHYTPAKLGWLLRDNAVEQANQCRRPLQLSDPGHPNTRRIAQFAGNLIAEKQHAAA